MRHIRKNPQPPSILQKITTPTTRNPTPTYSKLRSQKRQKLREALSTEQGYICCYCEQRLAPDKSHIEHLQPQSIADHLSLDYRNLLVSCQAKLQSGDPKHCGMAKDNWFDEKLMVSPLWEDCTDFFEYSLAGEIMATKDVSKNRASKETIDHLELNIDKLKAMRLGEITPLFELELSLEEVQKLIESYAVTDHQGHYQPFGSALIHLLKLEYSIDVS